jgi:predicted ATPase
MSQKIKPGPSAENASSIPLLTQVVPASEIPDAVLVALDARLAEKASVFALSQELMLNLRPELDRMAAELVQRSVQGMWDKRAEVYQRIGRQSD